MSNNFKRTLTEYRVVLHCEGNDFEENPETLLEGPFFTKRIGLYSRPGGFILYGKLVIDFFTKSKLLYPNSKVRIKLIRARPYFYMTKENPKVSLGFVICFLYIRRVMFKEDYRKKRLSQLPYAPVEYNYMESLAKTYIIPAQQKQFMQKIIFNNAPIRRITIAMKSNSAFTASFANNLFWFHLRGIRILRGGQPFVHHDTT